MIIRLRLSGFLPLLVLFFAPQPRACAQARGGSLQGEVLDPAGAVVPGAAVSLSPPGQVFNTVSGATGTYSFRNLSAGAYSASVSAKGFAPLSVSECPKCQL